MGKIKLKSSMIKGTRIAIAFALINGAYA